MFDHVICTGKIIEIEKYAYFTDIDFKRNCKIINHLKMLILLIFGEFLLKKH